MYNDYNAFYQKNNPDTTSTDKDYYQQSQPANTASSVAGPIHHTSFQPSYPSHYQHQQQPPLQQYPLLAQGQGAPHIYKPQSYQDHVQSSAISSKLHQEMNSRANSYPAPQSGKSFSLTPSLLSDVDSSLGGALFRVPDNEDALPSASSYYTTIGRQPPTVSHLGYPTYRMPYEPQQHQPQVVMRRDDYPRRPPIAHSDDFVPSRPLQHTQVQHRNDGIHPHMFSYPYPQQEAYGSPYVLQTAGGYPSYAPSFPYPAQSMPMPTAVYTDRNMNSAYLTHQTPYSLYPSMAAPLYADPSSAASVDSASTCSDSSVSSTSSQATPLPVMSAQYNARSGPGRVQIYQHPQHQQQQGSIPATSASMPDPYNRPQPVLLLPVKDATQPLQPQSFSATMSIPTINIVTPRIEDNIDMNTRLNIPVPAVKKEKGVDETEEKKQRKKSMDSIDGKVVVKTEDTPRSPIGIDSNRPQKRKYQKRVETVTDSGMVIKIQVPRIVKNDIRRQYLSMLTNVLNTCDFPFMYAFIHTFCAPDVMMFKQNMYILNGNNGPSGKKVIASPPIVVPNKRVIGDVSTSSDSSTSTPPVTGQTPASSEIIEQVADQLEPSVISSWPPYVDGCGPHTPPDDYKPLFPFHRDQGGMCVIGRSLVTYYWQSLLQIIPDQTVQFEEVKLVTRSNTDDCFIICKFNVQGVLVYDVSYHDIVEDLCDAMARKCSLKRKKRRTSDGSVSESDDGEEDGEYEEEDEVSEEQVIDRDDLKEYKPFSEADEDQLLSLAADKHCPKDPSHYHDPIAERARQSKKPVGKRGAPLHVQGLFYIHINEDKQIRTIDFRLAFPSDSN